MFEWAQETSGIELTAKRVLIALATPILFVVACLVIAFYGACNHRPDITDSIQMVWAVGMAVLTIAGIALTFRLGVTTLHSFLISIAVVCYMCGLCVLSILGGFIALSCNTC